MQGNRISANLREAQLRMLDILVEVDRICEKHDIKYFLSDGTCLGAVRHKGFIPWDDDIDIGMLREDYNKFLKVAINELGSNYFMQNTKTDKFYDLYHIPLKIRDNNSYFIEEYNKKYHQGIYIDVFPFDNIPKSKFKYKLQKKISKILVVSYVKTKDRIDFSNKKELLKHPIYSLIRAILSYEKITRILNKLKKWNDKDGEYVTYGIETIWDTVYKKEWIFPLKKIEFEGKAFWAPNNHHEILKSAYGDYMSLPKEEDRVWHSKEIIIK